MPLYAKTLKHSAREAMRAAIPAAWLVTLIFFLLTDVLSEVVYTFIPAGSVYDQSGSSWITLFLTVLLAIYQAVMAFGYSCWALHTARGEQPGLGSLMEGFGMVGRVLMTEVNIFLGIIGWGVLLSIGYVLSMFAVAAMSLGAFGLLIMIVLSVLFYASVMAVTLRYDLAHFLLCDYPEAGPGRAVRRSLDMMYGHTWDLMKLYLSFWPWYLLSFILSLVVVGVTISPMVTELVSFLQSGDINMMTTMVQTALTGTLATILTMVTSIPLQLIFHPYQRITVANFYRALSVEPVEQAPFDTEF